MLSSEQNPEECDATDDAICTVAGYKIILHIITLRQAQGDSSFLTFAPLYEISQRNRTAEDICDHQSPGCGENDTDGKVPAVWRRYTGGGCGEEQ